MLNKTELLNRISDKEDRILLSSVYDKLEKSYQKGYPIYSDFLDERQIALAKQLFSFYRDELCFSGGVSNAERQLCYLDFGYGELPVKIIGISSSAGNKFGHRDVLGALMGLGIKRQKLGDIVVGDVSYFLVKEEIVSFVMENLNTVGRYPVSLEILENTSLEKEQNFSYRSTTVSSLRLDCLVSDIAKLSREKAKELILAGKVKVNHFETTQYNKQLSAGDLISISQKGRFVLEQMEGITRKDRMKILIKKYE
ncbi:MAG: hypothetical protein J6A61_01140 [Clostridia bacterium]|nr:hypothetical protein [Clostridia bacterium]